LEPFKGNVIEELPPSGRNFKFSRTYLKVLPLLFVFPIVMMPVMWWAKGLPMDSIFLWISVIAFIAMEPFVYLVVEKARITMIYPITFYSNGIELKVSKLDKIHKVPNFIDRTMIDSVSFLEFEYASDGVYHHETKIDLKLKKGRSINIGHPNNEVSLRIKGIVEKNYSVSADWRKFQLNQKQQQALDKVRPKIQQSFCIHCGDKIESGNQFCTSCGGKQS
jgi:hypothetical protein